MFLYSVISCNMEECDAVASAFTMAGTLEIEASGVKAIWNDTQKSRKDRNSKNLSFADPGLFGSKSIGHARPDHAYSRATPSVQVLAVALLMWESAGGENPGLLGVLLEQAGDDVYRRVGSFRSTRLERCKSMMESMRLVIK